MNPCTKCGANGSGHLVCFKGRYEIGCGGCLQEHQGFTYAPEAVNFWNQENPLG